MDALTNLQIDAMFHNKMSNKTSKHYGGCFVSDAVVDMTPEEGKVYVINIDNLFSAQERGEKMVTGTHWVGVSNLRRKTVYYFDSFGMPPPTRIEAFMRKAIDQKTKKPKEILWNTEQIQDMRESSCGYWVVYVLRELIYGKSFDQILSDDRLDLFHEWRNEKIISNLKKMMSKTTQLKKKKKTVTIEVDED